MPLIDATIGGASANCYLTLSAAVTRMATMQRTAAFTALATDDDRERCLIAATQRIERVLEWDYHQIGHTRASITQALTFPRVGTRTKEGDNWYATDVIPPFVLDAVVTQAVAEATSDRDAEPAGRGIRRQKADVLEIEYDDTGAAATQRPITDSVYAILAPWLTGVPSGDKYQLSTASVLRV